MDVQKVSFVIPVSSMKTTVSLWATLLGIEPTFVDGDRWAQFDVVGSRISLAGADRSSDTPGIMLKVVDIEAARNELISSGLSPGPVVVGPHETRVTVRAPGPTSVTLYGSPVKPSSSTEGDSS